jgi:VWFA-related protein
VDIVHLDVSVLDGNRQPVLGLTAEDFTVLEDGKPQPILVFDAVHIAPPAPPTAAWMREVPPDVTTNRVDQSRLFVIVVDDACLPADRLDVAMSARQAARGVVERLQPDDLAAVVFTATNKDAQDFTSQKSRLHTAVDRQIRGWGCDVYFQLASVQTLTSVADYLAAAPQRRKAMVWISAGLPVGFDQAGPVLIDPAIGAAARDASLTLVDKTVEMLRRAHRANVAVYAIDPHGLRVPPTSPEVESLVMTSTRTGGRALVHTNDFASGIEQIFAENRAYYVLGFRSSPHPPGSFHRLEVKVNRPDVDVRARNGHYTPEPERPADRQTSPLATAIAGLLPQTDLPMEVALAPFAIPGESKAAVTIALGIRQPIPTRANARVTEVTQLQTAAFSPEGDPRGTQRHTARVSLRPGSQGEAEYEALSRIDLPPGRYRLRLAAHSESSRNVGSVFADVDVPDFASFPFSVSGVAMRVEPARPSAPRDVFDAILPFAPTAVRTFTVTEKVTAWLQIHQDGRRAFQPVTVATRIVDARDRLAVNERRELDASRFAVIKPPPPSTSLISRSSWQIEAPRGSEGSGNPNLLTSTIEYRLPLDRLSSGPHLLTFAATRGGTTIERHVRFMMR